MEMLPAELVVMILPHLGGADFINVRRTCKRLKDIADELEISSSPALWRWYVLCDFPGPCVESVAPWLYLEVDKNDPFLWKMLYKRLKQIASLRTVPLRCTHLRFDDRDVHLTKDVKFIGQYSLPELIVQGKLKEVGTVNLLWTVSILPQFYHDGTSISCLSTWTTSTICYPTVYNVGERVWSLHINNSRDNSSRKIQLRKSVNGFKSLDFNEKRIAALGDSRTMYIIPNIASELPVDVFTYTLRCEATKIKILGDIVLVLFCDGAVETTEVVTDKTKQLTLSDWRLLVDKNCRSLCSTGVSDFVIKGQLFAAIRTDGEVLLSHFQSLDHDCLVRNLHSPFKIPISEDNGSITQMAVDVDDGVKIAAVEICGYPLISKLHLLYIDRT